jgi:hypothetical protein
MHRLALALTVALTLALFGTSALADVKAPAPAAKPASAATAQMNVPFALDFYNIRIQKIEWDADGTATFKKLQLSASDEGLGTLVMTAEVKANGNDRHVVPTSSTQLIYKDGSTSTEANLQPYTLSGRRSESEYQAGDGGTIIFVLPNMPPPSSDNPITKIVFSQSWEDLKPKLIRLQDPTITLVR